jgi:hypothetical protein
MNVTASIPEGPSLHAGDDNKPPMTLSEWVRKWGGKFKLPEGKSVDDIRRAAVREKHGV